MREDENLNQKPGLALNGKKLLVVGCLPQMSAALKMTFGHWGCQTILAQDYTQAFNTVQAENIDAVIIEANQVPGASLALLDSIRSIKPEKPHLFLLSNQVGTSAATLSSEAFAKGAEAVFGAPYRLRNLITGVSLAFSEPFGKYRDHKRVRALNTLIQIGHEGTSLTGSLINVSRGGMFIHAPSQILTHAETIEFSINTRMRLAARPTELNGRAYVKWMRPSPDHGRPAGFGVEFAELSPATQDYIESLLHHGGTGPSAFLPPKKTG